MYSVGSLPTDRRDSGYSHASKSATHSPARSRNSSLSSIASAQTDPEHHSRRSSATSATSKTSSKSGLKSLFSRKEKHHKEKKDADKIVLTSKHAAAVKTKMQMDPKYKHKKSSKTADVVGTLKTSHLTAAEQEARHPHSGPPARHILKDMPLLTRILSGDERDEEEEVVMLRRQSEWDMAKKPSVARIREHDGEVTPLTSADNSADEDGDPVQRRASLSPGIERALYGEERRSSVVARNSYGTRFRRDESGKWTRGRD